MGWMARGEKLFPLLCIVDPFIVIPLTVTAQEDVAVAMKAPREVYAMRNKEQGDADVASRQVRQE